MKSLDRPLAGSLQGKVAVVTGASRGAGRGIALALAEAGATVQDASLHERVDHEPLPIEVRGLELNHQDIKGGEVCVLYEMDSWRPWYSCRWSQRKEFAPQWWGGSPMIPERSCRARRLPSPTSARTTAGA